MFNKAVYILILLFSVFNLSAMDIPNEVVELSKKHIKTILQNFKDSYAENKDNPEFNPEKLTNNFQQVTGLLLRAFDPIHSDPEDFANNLDPHVALYSGRTMGIITRNNQKAQ